MLRAHDGFGRGVFQLELELLADSLHAAVFGKNLRRDALKLFFAANLHEAAQQFDPQPAPLVSITDENGKLSCVGPRLLAEPADAENLRTARLRDAPATRSSGLVRPTLPAFSVAPMTATVAGEKNTSSGRRSAWRMSWAGSAVGLSVRFMCR